MSSTSAAYTPKENNNRFRFRYTMQEMKKRNLKNDINSISLIRKEYEQKFSSITNEEMIKYSLDNKLIEKDDLLFFPALNYDIIKDSADLIFNDDSGFQEFVKKNEEYYNALINQYKNQYPDIDNKIEIEKRFDYNNQLQLPPQIGF